ncbi:hypothetical protein JV173_03310 [Acholeplasma equirhinis]|uniref:hypothetical protein n=1 Tax=Acholeplasma equirhinis TaxID=555393 RepID=UPI00197A912B|nr:hypothetical protein [Acholeplasma equirhinis]MBN3490537.1 hypothetical protein [Acholeplasma equirhinis]
MKKITNLLLLLLIAITGTVLFSGNAFAFEPGVDDYHDLFYEKGVTFTIETVDGWNATFSEGTFDALNNLLIKNGMSVPNVDRLTIAMYVNYEYFAEGSIYYNSPGTIAIDRDNGVSQGTVISSITSADSTNAFYSMNGLFEGDVITFGEDSLLIWSDLYDYGRMNKKSGEPWRFYKSSGTTPEGIVDGAYISNHPSPSSEYGAFGLFSGGATTGKAYDVVYQSPYSNFKIQKFDNSLTYKEFENVHFVYVQTDKTETNLHKLWVYYWEDGELEFDSWTWDGVTQVKAFFYGGYSEAISGQEFFATSVDAAKPLSYFQGFLKAYDFVDGDITNQIYVVEDNYTTNMLVLGTYTVTFGVTDSSGNESTLEVSITVADVTKPVISGNASKVQISYTQTWNLNSFKTTLTVTDNYDVLDHADIVVESDGYTSNKTTLGTHSVVYSVTDSSGNKQTFTKEIEVIDDIAPVFSGPTVINKPIESILTLNQIKSQLTASDDKEGNKTSSITVDSDNYTGFGNVIGTYQITFKVSDSKGNSSYHTVTVHVQDNIPPVWYIQDGVTIKLVPPVALTRQQIIDLLVATGQFTISSTTQINYVVDEYTGNESTPGIYLMSIEYSSSSGTSGIHNFTITVLEDENEGTIILEPELTLWEQIVDYVVNHPIESTIIGLVAVLIVIVIFVLIFSDRKSYISGRHR